MQLIKAEIPPSVMGSQSNLTLISSFCFYTLNSICYTIQAYNGKRRLLFYLRNNFLEIKNSKFFSLFVNLIKIKNKMFNTKLNYSLENNNLYLGIEDSKSLISKKFLAIKNKMFNRIKLNSYSLSPS